MSSLCVFFFQKASITKLIISIPREKWEESNTFFYEFLTFDGLKTAVQFEIKCQ